MIEYTDPALVESVGLKTTPYSPYEMYGRKIPTEYVVRYLGRERRVYNMCYANSGSLWINVKDREVFLDTDTEHRLENIRYNA